MILFQNYIKHSYTLGFGLRLVDLDTTIKSPNKSRSDNKLTSHKFHTTIQREPAMPRKAIRLINSLDTFSCDLDYVD